MIDCGLPQFGNFGISLPAVDNEY